MKQGKIHIERSFEHTIQAEQFEPVKSSARVSIELPGEASPKEMEAASEALDLFVQNAVKATLEPYETARKMCVRCRGVEVGQKPNTNKMCEQCKKELQYETLDMKRSNENNK